MEKLKILIPISVKPHSTSQISFLYDNLFDEFKKHIEIEVTWFVYLPEKWNITNNKHETILQIQEFSDAETILDKIEPDIVFATPSWNFVDYAFCLAAKKRKIPVISGTGQNFTENYWVDSILKTTLASFNFEDDKLGKPFARLRFLIKKILFLFRTQRKLGIRFNHIFESFWQLYKHYKAKIVLLYDHEFSTDLCWVSGEENYNKLIQAGYKKEQLILSGNPIYDKIFQNKVKFNKIQKDKIKILFAAHPLYEHGYWQKKQQDETIIKIVNELNKHQTEFEIIVKIHPTSSIKKLYSDLIQKINPEIKIVQEGSVEHFFDKIDVIVSYDHSSVNIIGFLSNIPSVVCNFYNEENRMHSKYGITNECKDILKLKNEIIKTIKNKTNENKYKKFIHDLFFKDDGFASKRIFDGITKLLKNEK